MTKTNYTYKKGDAPWTSARSGWDQTTGDSWRVTGGASGLGQWINNNRWKTAALVGVLSLVALTSAYFLSPAYAAFVGKTAASAIAVVSNGAKALYAFAAANPVFAIFLAVVVVAAVITAGVLAYMNNDKANKIDEVKQKIVEACEKDNDGKPKVDDGKFKFDGAKISSALEDISNAVRLIPAQGQSQNG